jgi:hypothetical protein
MDCAILLVHRRAPWAARFNADSPCPSIRNVCALAPLLLSRAVSSRTGVRSTRAPVTFDDTTWWTCSVSSTFFAGFLLRWRLRGPARPCRLPLAHGLSKPPSNHARRPARSRRHSSGTGAGYLQGRIHNRTASVSLAASFCSLIALVSSPQQCRRCLVAQRNLLPILHLIIRTISNIASVACGAKDAFQTG